MLKYKVVFLLYLVASTQALNWPESAPVSSSEKVHQRQKRETDEVHTIDVHELKEKLNEAYHTILPLMENLLADVSPSIHEEFITNFIPKIKEISGIVLPILRQKLSPDGQRHLKFAMKVAEEVAKRAYMSYKLSNSTHISIVSISDVIEDVATEIKPLFEFVRFMARRVWKMHAFAKSYLRVQRDVRYVMHEGKSEKVHFIDVHELKDRLVETYHIIKPMLESLAAEISPSIYEKFVLTYMPALQHLKRQILPFFWSSIYPQASRYFTFAQNIGERLLDKAYMAFQLTNSTHIAIVSVSDVAKDVHNEIKPALNLFKFLSARLIMSNSHYRGKRAAENEFEGVEDEVHFISIRELKDKTIEAYHSIKPVVEKLLTEVAPSIYEKLTLSYLTLLRKLKRDMTSFFSALMYPKFQNYCRFVKSIADRLIDPTYRSYKMSNSTHIAIISITDIVDEVYKELELAREIVKYYSTRITVYTEEVIHHGLHRSRDAQREAFDMLENELPLNKYEIHTIDVHELKDKIAEAYRTIRPLIEKLIADVTPSIYSKIASTYLPPLRQLKNDVLPFLKAKILPEVQKYLEFAHSIAEKLAQKAYQSYKLSNSTHITIVSVTDVVVEVYEKVKPALDFARFFAASMMKTNGHYRGKRSVMPEMELSRSKRQVPDLMFALISPFIENFVRSATSTFLGNGDSLISKVILPLAYDILGDPRSRFDCMSVFMVAKASLTPLIWEMMKRQTYDTPEGTIIRIPRHLYEKAINSFVTDARPIIRRLLDRHAQTLISNLAKSSKNVVDLLDRLMFERYEGAGILKDQVMDFFNKHRKMFKTSTSTHVNFYSVTEIMRDLHPIKFSALNVFIQYIKRKPNSWLNALFGDGAILQNIVLGSPTYAKPQTTARQAYVYRTKKQTYSKTG